MTHSDNPRNNGPNGGDSRLYRNGVANNGRGASGSPDLENDLQPDRTDFDRVQAMLGSRYQLNWIIGRGGMSTVWLARDTEQQRDVAVKILKPEYTENEEFRTRFRNEASAAEQLDSPNVVATYDYGEVRDRGAVFCYIIMEYVSGESLADVLARERTLPESLVLDIMAQTARGLQTIHATGMVHRDIKPGNLLITSDGVVKVTDLGIAKAAAAVPLTRTGMVVGTAQYVSPEQAQGNPVGPASDIYSLGVVGYEILAGERPFVGESTVSVAIKHISEDPRPLPETLSQNMRELIGICLRKNPEARYADGEELAAATVLVAEGNRPPQPHRVPAVEDFGDHPLTEQLGAVAHGPGTRVPPMQGPAMVAGGAAGAATGAAGIRGGAGAAAGAADIRGQRHQGPIPPGSVNHGSGNPAAGNRNAANGGAGTLGPRGQRLADQKPARKKSGAAPVVILGLLAVLAVGVAGYLLLSGGDDKAPGTQTRTITSRVTPPGQSDQNTQPDSPQKGLPGQGNDQGNDWFGNNPDGGGNQRPTDTTAPRGGDDNQPPSTRPEQSQPSSDPSNPSEPGSTGGNSSAIPGNGNGTGNGNGNNNPGNGNSGGPFGGNQATGGGTSVNPSQNSTGGNSTNGGGTGGAGQLADQGNTAGQAQPTAAVARGTITDGRQGNAVPVLVAAVKDVNGGKDSTRFHQQGQLI
nr:serine/threonine-protein kinase [uncultured Corynebacterium sp.]